MMDIDDFEWKMVVIVAGLTELMVIGLKVLAGKFCYGGFMMVLGGECHRNQRITTICGGDVYCYR